MFSRRAEVEARSAEGFTPLLIAAQEGHTEAVEVRNDGRGGTCHADFSRKRILYIRAWNLPFKRWRIN